MNSLRGGMLPREQRGMPPPLRGGTVQPPQSCFADAAVAPSTNGAPSRRAGGTRRPRGPQRAQRPHGPDGGKRWRRQGWLLLERTAGIPGKPVRRERPAPRRRLAVPQPVSTHPKGCAEGASAIPAAGQGSEAFPKITCWAFPGSSFHLAQREGGSLLGAVGEPQLLRAARPPPHCSCAPGPALVSPLTCSHSCFPMSPQLECCPTLG